MKPLIFLSVLTCVLLAACNLEPQSPTNTPASLDPQANYWQQLGGAVGLGEDASLKTDGTNTTIAYSEDDGTSQNITIKKWTGSTWTSLGSLSGSNDSYSAARSPSIALDNAGYPVVAWHERADYDEFNKISNIYIQRFNGTSWVNVGTGVLDGWNALDTYAYSPSVALDSSGNPVVAWSEDDTTMDHDIYVQRFNGTSWVRVGEKLNANTNTYDSSAIQPSLAIDSSDNPVVAWSEDNGSVYNIYVRRFNGTSWVKVGNGILNATVGSAYGPSLALDSSDNPVVAWNEGSGIYVQRFNGTSWVNVGSGVLNATTGSAGGPSLVLDESDNPIVSWEESDGTSSNLYIQQFNGSSWVNVGVTPLDTNLNDSAFLPSLSLVNGNLVVGWQEGPSSTLYVKRYITNVWQNVGGSLDVQGVNSAINSVVARTPANAPVIAWDESDSSTGSRNVYVKEWTGTAWRLLGGAVDRTLSNDAENPSLAIIGTVTNPVVAFQENNNVYVRWWNGSSWVNISDNALDTTLANDAVTPSLALETPRNPVVAYVEDGNILVKRANGVFPSTRWQSPYRPAPLDISAANDAFRPSLALKSDNNPIVAWYEDAGSSFNVYVKEWTGSAWVALGGSLDKAVARDAKDIVLAIRSDNRPVVAWEEAGNIFVKQWTGSAWVSLGGIIDKTPPNQALRPSLDLRSDNNPVVTWQEFVSHPHSGPGSSYHVYAKRWTGSAWTLVANVVDKSVYQDAERPSLVLKSDNNPIISWDEWDGTSENVYVKQYWGIR